MTRTTGYDALAVDELFRELGVLAEKRSELLTAEARLWAQAARLLSELAASKASVPHPTVPAFATDADGKHLLPVDDAAAYLSLSRATLDKWRVQGGGPEFARIGRRIFYRRRVLDQFISGRTYPHTSAYERK